MGTRVVRHSLSEAEDLCTHTDLCCCPHHAKSPAVITSHWTVKVNVNLLNELVIYLQRCLWWTASRNTLDNPYSEVFYSAKHQKEHILQTYKVDLMGIEPLTLAVLVLLNKPQANLFLISGNFPQNFKCKYVHEKWEKYVSPPQIDDMKEMGLESSLTVKWCSGNYCQKLMTNF